MGQKEMEDAIIVLAEQMKKMVDVMATLTTPTLPPTVMVPPTEPPILQATTSAVATKTQSQLRQEAREVLWLQAEARKAKA